MRLNCPSRQTVASSSRRTQKDARQVPLREYARSTCQQHGQRKKDLPLTCQAHQAAELAVLELPNGQSVRYLSKKDVLLFYREVYEDQAYLQHGIQLTAGDCVVDIGCNIGIFAIYAAQVLGPGGLVVAVEPIPQTFDALQHNVAGSKPWATAQGTQLAPITAVNCGVGDGSCRSSTFTFYRQAAGWSSMYPDTVETQANMAVYLDNSLSELPGGDSDPLLRMASMLQRYSAPRLYDSIRRFAVDQMLRSAERSVCNMNTVSELMTEHCLRKVDLLKIDVERAELDVLAGIAAEDWARIRQVVLEVHDTPPGRLQQVLHLLSSAGSFVNVVVDQNAALAGSSLYNVYARRH